MHGHAWALLIVLSPYSPYLSDAFAFAFEPNDVIGHGFQQGGYSRRPVQMPRIIGEVCIKIYSISAI